MQTPHFSAMNFETQFRDVYEPAEDTFLMLDALELDMNDCLQTNTTPLICLEIGCGSGVLTTALAKLLPSTLFFCTDINFKATQAIQTCAQLNQVRAVIEPINTNLSNGLDHRLNQKVNLMLFNPPYVPTEDEEINQNGLSQAWAGGLNGRRVIDRFLNQCIDLIAFDGLLYLLLLKENRPEEVMQRLREQKFDCEIRLQRKCRNEHLYIVKCRRRR